MRAAIPLSISAALALLFVVVLSSGKPLPTGTYLGERPVSSRPGADPVVIAQLGQMKVTIEPDGKSIVQDGGVPFEGRMTRQGDRLRFEVLTVADVNIEKQDPSVPRTLTFDVLPDGALRCNGIVLTPTSQGH